MAVEIIKARQGTDEWKNLRAGIPTASQFAKIVTRTGRASAQAEDYAGRLLAEWFLGADVDEWKGSYWTDRGTELEPEARRAYALMTGASVTQTGLIRRVEAWGTAGASPDGLVGGDGLLELKCPAPHTHLLYLSGAGVPPAYEIQVQAQLWVSARAWVDFMSYHPSLAPFHVRVEPDAKLHDAFDRLLPEFCASLAEKRSRLEAMGVERVEKIYLSADEEDEIDKFHY